MWQAQGSVRKEASGVGAASPMSPAVPGINAEASAQRCSICPGGVAGLLLNPLRMLQCLHNGCGRTPCLPAKNQPLDVSPGDREGGCKGKKSQVEAVVEQNNSQRLSNERTDIIERHTEISWLRITLANKTIRGIKSRPSK